MKQYLDNSYAEVTYDASIKTVITIWKRQNTAESYQEIFNTILQVVKETGATVYLSDITLQGAVGTASRKWMEQEIMPKAVQHGLKQVCTVVPNDVFQQFYYNNVKKEAAEKGFLDFQFFDSVDSARAFLQKQVAEV